MIVRGLFAGGVSAVFAVSVVGCGGGGGGGGYSNGGSTPPPSPSPSPGTSASWTVMVYSIAANSLEADELDTLAALQAVGSTPSVNIVCEIQTETIPFGTPSDTNAKRFFFQQGGTLATSQDNSNGYPQPVDMTSPGELQSFVAWAKKAHPAQKYTLILCDHGNQWVGFGQDEHAGQTKISYARLSSFLAGAQTGLGGASSTLDLLGFDACLMAGVEVADLAAPCAKVLVGSEEEETLDTTSPKGEGGVTRTSSRISRPHRRWTRRRSRRRS